MELGTYKVYRKRNGEYTFKNWKIRVAEFFAKVWYWTKVSAGVAVLIVTSVSVGWMIRGNEVSAQVNYMSTSTTTVIQEDSQVLFAIGDCESGDNGKPGSRRQFLPNGKVVTHTNSDGTVDVGMYEINMSAPHIIEMALMHIDPMTEEGNLAYAKHLHHVNGVSDWKASEHCWINHI